MLSVENPKSKIQNPKSNGLSLNNARTDAQKWETNLDSVIIEPDAIKLCLQQLETGFHLVETDAGIGIPATGNLSTTGANYLGFIPPLKPEWLGSHEFKQDYGTNFALCAGAMANGISSVELVTALGKRGYLASFGAAGLPLDRVEAAIAQIQAELGNLPYAFNLIHSPLEPRLERACVELYLKRGVKTIEASAFMSLTPNLVYYRAAGLSIDDLGNLVEQNRIIIKLSRREVAEQFIKPAPDSILKELVEKNLISHQQAELAARVPVASDITVEADSAGHTDNRPLVCLLPAIQRIRDRISAQYDYPKRIRVGAAGGISTPAAIVGALAMGADYVVTGSINQACVEAGTSDRVKAMLAKVDMADIIMTPAADMFEMGVRVQVVKRGTFYPMRAQKLYEIYRKYPSISEIPLLERQKIEKEIFQQDLDAVWQQTVAFFQQRDSRQIEKAEQNPKVKMALIFRWYLGLSSFWAKSGLTERQMDYQVWCGASMGAFNEWAKGTDLEHSESRRVADMSDRLMQEAAYLLRLQALGNLGIEGVERL